MFNFKGIFLYDIDVFVVDKNIIEICVLNGFFFLYFELLLIMFWNVIVIILFNGLFDNDKVCGFNIISYSIFLDKKVIIIKFVNLLILKVYVDINDMDNEFELLKIFIINFNIKD